MSKVFCLGPALSPGAPGSNGSGVLGLEFYDKKGVILNSNGEKLRKICQEKMGVVWLVL
jgi:hypothetical protein